MAADLREMQENQGFSETRIDKSRLVEVIISHDSLFEKGKHNKYHSQLGMIPKQYHPRPFFMPKTKHKTRRYHLPRRLLPSPGTAVSAFVISDTKGGLS